MYPLWASLMLQWVKESTCKAGTQETWVQPLGQEDHLEEGTATQSSILAWRIPRWATVHRVTKSRTQLKQLSSLSVQHNDATYNE